MTTLVIICSWYLLIAAIIEAIFGPFQIGKPRKDYSALSYVVSLSVIGSIIIIVGRVFGWW